MNKKRESIYIGIISLLLSSCSHSNDNNDEQLSQQCQEIKNYLKPYVPENNRIIFHRKFREISAPMVWFKIRQEGVNPITIKPRIADIDNDGDYELIYIQHITSPRHIQSKIFNIKSLSTEESDDLIAKGRKSKYYNKLKKYLHDQYKWGKIYYPFDADKAITDKIRLYVKHPTIKEATHSIKELDERHISKDIFNYHDQTLFLFTDMQSLHIWVLEVLDIEKDTNRLLCDLGLTKNWKK